MNFVKQVFKIKTSFKTIYIYDARRVVVVVGWTKGRQNPGVLV